MGRDVNHYFLWDTRSTDFSDGRWVGLQKQVVENMSKSYKILVVDDDAATRFLLEEILIGNGFRVLTADSGDTCLEMLNSERPALILLDVIMPGLSGFDVCRELQHREDTADIPVIFVTGLADRSDILEGFRTGGKDYIIKPLSSADVTTRVSTVLTTQQLRQDRMNLLKINGAMLEQIRRFLDEIHLAPTLDQLKSDLAADSMSVMDLLNDARQAIQVSEAEKAIINIDQAETTLQFADRVSQQINEFAKVMQHIHDIMTRSEVEQAQGNSSLINASTNSVLAQKTNQAEVDNLLESLGI